MRFPDRQRPRSSLGRTGIYGVCGIPGRCRQSISGGIEGSLLCQAARVTIGRHERDANTGGVVERRREFARWRSRSLGGRECRLLGGIG